MSEDWITQQPEEAEPSRKSYAPGIHYDISNEDYHASEGVSNSSLKLMIQSPAHLHDRDPYKSSRAMEIGTAIHTAILEPERYLADYRIIECDARTSALYKAACKGYPSAQVLTSAEAAGVEGMRDACYRNGAMSERLEAPGRTEVSVYAKDPETGLLVKCRFDKLPDDLRAFDLKKTQDARRPAFERAIWNYSYHMQAAFYSDVYYWATGERLRGFGFGAVEEKRPHGCKLYWMEEEAIEEGRRTYRAALNLYAECLASGDWFAYGDEAESIGLPPWAYSEIEDEMEVKLDERVD